MFGHILKYLKNLRRIGKIRKIFSFSLTFLKYYRFSMDGGIQTQDLVTFSKLGSALWIDDDYSQISTSETLAAVSLMNLNSERTLEKAVAALLERARVEGMAGNIQRNQKAISQPFYRLTPEERFVLVSLHVGRWSYQRLGRILEFTIEQVQELAWSARLQLCASGSYPAGPTAIGLSCPVYDPRKPWTQRFMDDEIGSKREFIFLQNHLMGCSSCSSLLSRTRDIHFKVEKEILGCVGKQDFSSSLKAVLDQGPYGKYLSHLTFTQSLRIFLRRKEIQWVGGFFLFLLLMKMVRHWF